jgi:diguanylate cyclase (GGDEF)-like protein
MRAAPVWGWAGAIAAGAALLYTTTLAGATSMLAGPHLPWFALAVLFFLAEAFPVHVDFRSETHTLSLSELAIVLGLFLAGPAELMLGVVAGGGLALALVRRQRPLKWSFNVSQFAFSAGVAILAFRALAGAAPALGPRTWLAAGAGAAVFGVVSVALVTVTIALVTGGNPVPELPQTIALALAGSLASASLAVVAVQVIEADSRAVWLLVVPALCWGLAFRAYGAQRKRHEHLEFLYGTMRATQGAPEFRAAVRELLVAARTMLSAEHAEILLFAGEPGEGALRSLLEPGNESLLEPVDLSADALTAIDATVGRETAILLPRGHRPHVADGYLAERGLDDALLISLRREQRTFGLLVVANRSGDVSTFTTDDRKLFETFAGHGGVLLENDRVKEQLRYQAYHDALTGLPNRSFFADRVRDALAEDDRDVTVLFLDLDDFKNVNDTLGHTAGDELLAAVAERVRACLAAGDVAARLGGDEFGILLETNGPLHAQLTASRVVDALRAPFVVHGHEASIHASIGIATEEAGEGTADELLAKADVAMYAAKTAGKRQYATYEPRMHSRLRRQHELVAALEHAVARDEIRVHYQPIVDLRDARTVGFEALVRWQHPSRGLLQPGAFLPLAEERGLIHDIGLAVLREACTQTVTWQRTCAGRERLTMNVNLSAGELLRDGLADEVAEVLAETGLDASSLVLEITETSAMTDPVATLNALHSLRRLGARLALDDFGTGYSSLSHLRDFPIDTLKIAKPFIDRLDRGVGDTTFVDAMLRLAATLDLDVVAEGIERQEQAELLRRLECGLGQGYHFARPLDAADATAHPALARRARMRVA